MENKFKIKNKPETETKTFRIPIPMANELDKLAKTNNISVNGLVIQCIDYALKTMK